MRKKQQVESGAQTVACLCFSFLSIVRFKYQSKPHPPQSLTQKPKPNAKSKNKQVPRRSKAQIS